MKNAVDILMEAFPSEIIATILAHLPARDLARCRRACWAWKSLCADVAQLRAQIHRGRISADPQYAKSALAKWMIDVCVRPGYLTAEQKEQLSEFSIVHEYLKRLQHSDIIGRIFCLSESPFEEVICIHVPECRVIGPRLMMIPASNFVNPSMSQINFRRSNLLNTDDRLRIWESVPGSLAMLVLVLNHKKVLVVGNSTSRREQLA